jgi:hypothetical protein
MIHYTPFSSPLRWDRRFVVLRPYTLKSIVYLHQNFLIHSKFAYQYIIIIMGERKVLNKYIPADFDPQLVPRGKKPKDDLVTVRMMLPFSIQCSTCSTFLYRGRKFNSKKESVKGINGKYLGIQRYRFYIKCSSCSRPVTFRKFQSHHCQLCHHSSSLFTH